MIIVLKGSERAANRDIFDQHFRLRHEVFVKGRGWSLPSIHGLEIDQYDDDDAMYFLDLNEESRIQGSIRITPTVKSSLIADYFPHLVENGDSPRSPTVYECTRYIVIPPRKSREDNRLAKSRIIGAMLEWCMDNGLTYLQTVIDSVALPTYLELTPLTKPLGLPHPYGGGRKTPGGGECMAIRWPICTQVLDDVRAYGGLTDAGLMLAPAHAALPASTELVH
ncbi:MAG: acyl-homoserine-lactone synthase [Xanthobacteraceae bacterium]